ncbi:hypothetical protein VKT23_002712 [Stygiomarasmius scandens]|uniref:Uncharacterized protein n=1 Tax=Marasmiellus scandens TaxID=2682957 RepID=A0ABR1K8B4_9AGAR
MPNQRAGHPRKSHQGRNISGLRNQKSQQVVLSRDNSPIAGPRETSPVPGPSQQHSQESEQSHYHMLLDSNTRINWMAEDQFDLDSGSDIDEEAEIEDLNSKFLALELAEVARCEVKDDEWIPKRYKKPLKNVHESRITEYHKGPDKMSTSTRTQYRYKEAWATQTTLDGNMVIGGAPVPGVSGWKRKKLATTEPGQSDRMEVDLNSSPEQSPPPSPPQLLIPQRRKASASPEQSDDELSPSDTQTVPPASGTEGSDSVVNTSPSSTQPSSPAVQPTFSPRKGTAVADEAELSEQEADEEMELEIETEIVVNDNELDLGDGEYLEDELEENVGRPFIETRPWDVLRDQLKAHLKKNKKSLPLTQESQGWVQVKLLQRHGMKRMGLGLQGVSGI